MGTSSEYWASGVWTVQAGSEDEFVERWRTWLEWTSTKALGFRSATLIRYEADSDSSRSPIGTTPRPSHADWRADGTGATSRRRPGNFARIVRRGRPRVRRSS